MQREAGVNRSRRVISLLQVADVLGIAHTSRKERRRRALRAVRKMERRQCARFLVREGKEYVVSVRAFEGMLADNDVSLSGLEKSVAELGEIQRHIRRQLNGHGARLKEIERWRALTTQYLSDCAGEIATQSSQHRARGTG
jgi:hypothetical protein